MAGMRNQPPRRFLTALLLTGMLATPGGAHAQAAQQYSLSAAINAPILVRSCQNDLTQIQGVVPVRMISNTLVESVQTAQSGTVATIMTAVSTGRFPVTIYFVDDTFIRLIVQACPNEGANNLVRLVDDRPAPKSAVQYAVPSVITPIAPAAGPAITGPAAAAAPVARPVTTSTSTLATLPAPRPPAGATPSPAAPAATPAMTLPVPAGVSMDAALTDKGLLLTIRNGAAQPLQLNTADLVITAGSDIVPTGSATTTLQPGMQTSILIPVPAGTVATALQAVWTVGLPGINATFPLPATFR